MKNDFVYQEMIEQGADGVDFVPISFGENTLVPIYKSYTKEEWLKEECVLKTNRKYWKIDEQGRKIYL